MADIEDYCEICDGPSWIVILGTTNTTETTCLTAAAVRAAGARATTWRMTMKIFLRTTFGLGWLLVGFGAVRSFDPAWIVMWLGFTVMILSVIGGEIFL